MQRGLLQQDLLQGQVAIGAGCRRRHDHAKASARCKQTHASFHCQGVEVAC